MASISPITIGAKIDKFIDSFKTVLTYRVKVTIILYLFYFIFLVENGIKILLFGMIHCPSSILTFFICDSIEFKYFGPLKMIENPAIYVMVE